MERVTTWLVVGFLGAGKTTLLRSWLPQRPAHARWSVLVNEFGEVGLDGLLLGDEAGVEVREVAGGCVCCTGQVALMTGLAALLRRGRPDVLWLEPTGLVDTGGLVDLLRGPMLAQTLDVQGVVAAVDVGAYFDDRYRRHPLWQAQIEAADVVVLTRCDRHEETQIATVEAWLRSLYPPRDVVRSGLLAPARLPAGVSTEQTSASAAPRCTELTAGGPMTPLVSLPTRVMQRRASATTHGMTGCGWVFPAEWSFDAEALEALLMQLPDPTPGLPAGCLRIKGAFHTNAGWASVQVDPHEIRWERTAWRRDSRLELLVPGSPAPDWLLVQAALLATRRLDPDASSGASG